MTARSPTGPALVLVVPLLLACSEPDGGAAAQAGAPDASRPEIAPPVVPAHAPVGPPPIHGGTLLATRDGLFVVAAVPEADRVVIVGVDDRTPGCNACADFPKILSTVDLPQGEEPFRLAEDGEGRVHVVLRKGGAVATIDIEDGALLARRPVCPEPRGVAYDPGSGLLHVACASGDLVSLAPATGVVTRRMHLAVDLRDVLVVPGGLVVSRFKSAELLRLDAEGAVIHRAAPGPLERGSQDLSVSTTDPLTASVAWRAVGTPDGKVFLLHQYGVARPIDLEGEGRAPSTASPYAASRGAGCGGLVAQTVATQATDGRIEPGLPLPVQALSVDVAASAGAEWLAVAHPGSPSSGVTVYRTVDIPALGRSPVRCADAAGSVPVQPDAMAVAVAMLPGREPNAATLRSWLVVQTRSPSELAFYQGFDSAQVVLGLTSVANEHVGHDLFHLDPDTGIACAQCHPEGAEDGRSWTFVGLGARRTQALHVGLGGTEPFHWSGDLPTFEALVDETFVRRMGAPSPSYSEVQALERWVFGLRPPSPRVDPHSEAAYRGRALFESAELGCSTCHAGAGLGRSTSEDVGVSSPERFQVPLLRGVAYRAPFLHDGRAATLRDRFTAAGGGDSHGRTSQLSREQIDDLVTYLESL